MKWPWRRPAPEEPLHTGIYGVLLAAGGATRFGAPKQLAFLGNQPLVRYALDQLAAAFLSEGTFVVVGAHGEEVAEVVLSSASDGTEIVWCEEWEEGLSASLRAGIAAAQAAGAAAVILHLADLPGVSLEAIDAVTSESFDEDGRLHPVPTRATYHGVDGHPVVLPRSLFPELLALRGDQGARELLAGPTTRRIEVGHLADPTDVDTPQDLEVLQP